MSVANIRRSYDWSELHESNMAAHPIDQLDKWLQDAIRLDVIDPTAMTLATVNANGQPSARIVLLKGLDHKGLVFYTNYMSRKGQDLSNNPQASVLFYWAGIERQIRVEGTITKTSYEQSDKYFHSRPLDSRYGAIASPQSLPISREQLEKRMQETIATSGSQPSRPNFWGGYLLQPQYFEFWQGRKSRLHDRIIYTLTEMGTWQLDRLAP